jgi:hypothetical protein
VDVGRPLVFRGEGSRTVNHAGALQGRRFDVAAVTTSTIRHAFPPAVPSVRAAEAGPPLSQWLCQTNHTDLLVTE